MDSTVYREGMPLPKYFQPAPGLEGVHYLRAQHGKGWVASSFFVQREQGNILVSPLVYTEALGDFIEEHGGIELIFVTHSDEISPAVLSEVGRDGPGEPPARIPACQYKERFQCRIAVHAADAGAQEECRVDLPWRADLSLAADLQFIHTPWHTPGSASLLLDSGAGRLLFCGDVAALDERGQVSTEFEPEYAPSVRDILMNWSTIVEHEFETLVPLHTKADSPSAYIARGGREALKAAHDQVSAWLSQFGGVG